LKRLIFINALLLLLLISCNQRFKQYQPAELQTVSIFVDAYFNKYLDKKDIVEFKNQSGYYFFDFKKNRIIDSIIDVNKSNRATYIISPDTLLSYSDTQIYILSRSRSITFKIDTISINFKSLGIPEYLNYVLVVHAMNQPKIVSGNIFINCCSSILNIYDKKNLKLFYSYPLELSINIKKDLIKPIMYNIPENYYKNTYRDCFLISNILDNKIYYSPRYSRDIYFYNIVKDKGEFIEFGSSNIGELSPYEVDMDSPKRKMKYEMFSTRYGKIDFLESKNRYVRYAQSAKTSLDKISDFSFKNLYWYLVFADKDFNVLYEVKFDGAQYLNNYFFRNDELWVQKTSTNNDKKIEFAQIEIP
jgi:hypothetical protein